MPGRNKPLMAVALAAALLCWYGCEGETIEGTGEVSMTGRTAFLLPPGHPGILPGDPGNLFGSTLVLPAEVSGPVVHFANCFAGVPAAGDIGVGSAVGFSMDYIGTALLPVNVNLGSGSTVLDSYTIGVDVSDPSVVIDASNVYGSNPQLSSSNCRYRGCPPSCLDDPISYPAQFSRAPGFESAPTVTPSGTGVIIEAVDGGTVSTQGTVNLCSVRINIVAELPPEGVIVYFNLVRLRDPSGNDIHNVPAPDGVVIRNFQLQ